MSKRKAIEDTESKEGSSSSNKKPRGSLALPNLLIRARKTSRFRKQQQHFLCR